MRDPVPPKDPDIQFTAHQNREGMSVMLSGRGPWVIAAFAAIVLLVYVLA